MAAPVLGGFGDEKPATDEVQDACDKIKTQFMKETGANATEFKAVVYKSQVVAGKNYLVKVSIGGCHFYHVKIFVPLPHAGGAPQLTGWQCGKTRTDALTSF
ncbi:leukocyte cysteine proteinase inhibitor 1-like [Anomaloglossus baeobatrachus]|uniref:leukocyte cysteine proteinase inhibitor 1-like n=1 Tax=Anomaloglossus baeobatrachus TaxID=238106 RepID=UPI003F506AC9